MIFSRALALVALPLLAVATAIQGRNDSPPSGSDLCCESTGKASDPSISKELELLGITVQDIDALVGVACSPITVVGVGSGTCSDTTVTCTDNSHGGLVAIGCVPITV
ncbi:fungal hydrophobin-domain-containing protein [Cerioporus squamosus]|nr:fungal hydrophobin-domain-containing protein [Cerioporus squamosus]